MPELAEIVPHYIEGWETTPPVHDPARAVVAARTPLASNAAVDAVVQAGRQTFQFYTGDDETISRWFQP